MGIKTICNNCKTSYNLKDELAGKKVKCSKCGNTIQVLEKEVNKEYNIKINQENNKLKKSNKIIKAIKIFGILILSLIIILFISIYISSLNGYKESDFNIPKDFFKTKYADKDPLSKDNGWNDFVIFNEGFTREQDAGNYLNTGSNNYRISKGNFLDKDIDLKYLDLLSKCTFKDKNGSDGIKYDKKYCDKELNNISTSKREKNIQKFKILVDLNKSKYEKIEKKEFILQPQEYTNGNLVGKYFTNNIINYGSSIRYISYTYFESGDYEKGIDILLNYQRFIDNIINKGDYNMLNSLILIQVNNINIGAINYFISNYRLDNNLNNKILNLFDKQLKSGFIKNGVKRDYKNYLFVLKKIEHDMRSEVINNKGVFVYLEYKFLYSHKETLSLIRKNYYDIIKDNGKSFLNNLTFSLHNYIGRIIFKRGSSLAFGILKKEKETKKLRNDILEKLKKDIENEKNKIETSTGSVKTQPIVSTGSIINKSVVNTPNSKDLGNGFKLIQSLDNTLLLYNGKVAYSWSHVSRVLPFIWDEGCKKLSDKFIKIGNNKVGEWKQKIWDNFGEKNRKQCIKENYYNSISVSKFDGRFYTINKSFYEGKIKILFDSETNKVYKINYGELKRIEVGKTGIFVLFIGSRGNDGGLIFHNKLTNKSEILFRNNDLSNNDIKYKQIIDFELINDKQVKIFYFGQNNEKKELIINL